MISERTLSNGVRVVMEQMPGLSSVSVGVWVKTGAVDEEKRSAGISHFVEHMMFKGTHKRDARAISTDMERIGAQMNAFTGKEATCYYAKSTSDHVLEAAEVICDMLEDSLFQKEELDRERRVVLEELKMGEDTPEDVAHDNLVDMLFAGTPLANSVIGSRTALARITHPVMRDYVERMYARNAFVVSVAGNFDPDEICSFFEGRFQSRRAERPDRGHFQAPYQPALRAATREIQQCHICMGTKCVTLQDDRSYVFQILSGLLGGGMSSRFFQHLREQMGLCYTVYSSLGTFADDGYFEIYAAVSPENTGKTLQAVREELKTLAEGEILQEELDSAREQLKAGYVFSQESTSSRMVANGRNALLLGKVFRPEEVVAGYDAVTLDDLAEAKEMICDFDQYSVSVVSGRRTDLRRLTGR